jgi:integrase
VGSTPTRPTIYFPWTSKRTESKGVIDTASHAGNLRTSIPVCNATDRATRDITADLRGALAPRTTEHHAAITDLLKVGQLLRAIDGYDGQPTTAAALKLAPYVFVRPTELRAAGWSELMLDGEQPEWRIPAE